MRKITLCADDFAQSPAISSGILRLVEAERLSAVSCMTDSPHWPEMAVKLRALAGHHQVGLHFNLTHDYEGAHRPILPQMLDSWRGNLNLKLIRHLFIRQWIAFEAHYGQPPEFVDGHQHVHAFPGIRKVVIEETRLRNPHAWLRLPRSTGLSGKSLVIRAMTAGFSASAEKNGLAINTDFSGFRPYSEQFNFGRFFRNLLTTVKNGTLVMCHPGEYDGDPTDPISGCRATELEYLGSHRLLLDLATHRVKLAPMVAIIPPRRCPMPVGRE